MFHHDDKFLGLFVKIVLSVFVFAIFINTVTAVKVTGNELAEIAFYKKEAVLLGEVSLLVTLADTNHRRKKGLSNTESLAKDGGMLFIFDDPDYYGIWMKDMNYPIDIIWVDENFEVVDFQENASPDSYPNSFIPKSEAQYILEVNSGLIESRDIQLGDRLLIL